MEADENEDGYVCYVWSQSKLNKYLLAENTATETMASYSHINHCCNVVCHVELTLDGSEHRCESQLLKTMRCSVNVSR